MHAIFSIANKIPLHKTLKLIVIFRYMLYCYLQVSFILLMSAIFADSFHFTLAIRSD